MRLGVQVAAAALASPKATTGAEGGKTAALQETGARAAPGRGFVGPLAEALAELSGGKEKGPMAEAPVSDAPRADSWGSVRARTHTPGPVARAVAPDVAAVDRPGPRTQGAPSTPADPPAPPADAVEPPLLVAPPGDEGGPWTLLSLTASLGSWISASAGAQSPPAAAATPAPVATQAPATGVDAALALPPSLPEAATIHVLAHGAATQAARVEIRHPELGAIQIDLRLEQGMLEVRAVAASATSAMALRSSESALRESIAVAGIELRSLTVDRREDDADANRRTRRRPRRRSLDTEA